MSDDQVKRYQLDYHHTQTYAEMVEDCDGDWVKYNDYKAASDRIEELEAKLAKAVEALELALELADNDLVDFSEYGLSCDADINERYRTTLAELKGQGDDL